MTTLDTTAAAAPSAPASADYIIRRVRIKNFRGIEALDLPIEPGGVIAAGWSDTGKTTLVNAISAGAAGQDIGADAIRIGADKAEILIDMEAFDKSELKIHRVIKNASPSTITVHKDGFKATSPMAFLRKLVGASGVDPLDLLKADEKVRRELVLAAIPVSVTEEQLRQWAPTLPDRFSVEGHGLDVIRRAHEHFYELRTVANANAKSAVAEADRLGRLVQATLITASLAEARTIAAARVATLAELEGKARAFDETQKRTEASRSKIAGLRDEAARAEMVAAACPVRTVDRDAAGAACLEALRLVKELEQQLAVAREAHVVASAEKERIDGLLFEAGKLLDLASSARTSAQQLEDALASAIAPEVTSAELAAARAAVDAATRDIEQAEEAERREKARAEASVAAERAALASATASDLDRTVKRLDAAPGELLAGAQGIPGLSLLGNDIAFNGVAIGKLCGKQQIHACVEIARRMSAGCKFLIVDGLERLDSRALDEFLTIATRDGWQLIGTRVVDQDPHYIVVQPAAAALAMTPHELAALAALAMTIAARRAGVDLSAPAPIDVVDAEADVLEAA